jgi:phosphatidylglycerol:prolipoprotein diacylglycerol transferase
MWNLALLILLFVYFKHKKFDGELFALYLAGYGLGRMWIEALRTDQLLLWPTNIPVSQLLSFLLVIGATIYLSMNYYHIFLKKAKKKAADTVKK